MKIIHHNDADGRCAAAIVAKRFPSRGLASGDFIEMDYSRELPLHRIQTQETVYIVDFSLKPDVMRQLTERTPAVHWIDHHQSCAGYDYGFTPQGLRDFTPKGLSGCELTWRYLFPELPVPYAAQLIGDYDSWRGSLRPHSWKFRIGLELYDQSPLGQVWNDVLPGPTDDDADAAFARATILEIIHEGTTCEQFRDHYCADLRSQYGFETVLDGHPAYALNVAKFGSIAFGTLTAQFPLCIAYVHNGRKWTVSVYSERPDIDCSAICAARGGGGHRGAAGFTCDILPLAPIPEA